MPFLLRNLALNPDENFALLRDRVLQRFALEPEDLVSLDIVRKGIDARRKPAVKVVYTVQFSLTDETRFWNRYGEDPELERVTIQPLPVFTCPQHRTAEIVIVGTGPAGLFTALRLAEYGLASTLIERGKPVEERMRDVELFWEKGILEPDSNVQFGEGGAGTFSDGKLTTRIRDANIRYVLTKLVDHGAPPEILYLAKPHVGTDLLRTVIKNIRRHLESKGVRILFRTKMTGLITSAGRVHGLVMNDCADMRCDHLILALGHSARDTYRALAQEGVRLERKHFAVGVRVEHPQDLINEIQYGIKKNPFLPPADYALAYNNRNTGRSAYSFCMCPGGLVVAAASEEQGVVTNGMSSYRRALPYANSALVVTVGTEDFPPGDLGGMELQRSLERKAFIEGGGKYFAPAQSLPAFLGRKGVHRVSSTYRPGITETDLSSILPPPVTSTLREGIQHFDRKMRGFITAEAILVGVETRTSSPVRITRGEDFQSVSHRGLYPAGEGAGYAGGIMSAAIDGIRVADSIAAGLAG